MIKCDSLFSPSGAMITGAGSNCEGFSSVEASMLAWAIAIVVVKENGDPLNNGKGDLFVRSGGGATSDATQRYSEFRVQERIFHP
jgi:hypothetical protein